MTFTISRRQVYGVLALVMIGLTAILSACTSSVGGAALTENTQSDQIQGHYNQTQPLLQPTGQSEYRNVLTYIEATHILGLNTYTFFLRKGGLGGPMFECPSIGAAVPNTAQLSNPMKIVRTPNSGSDPSWVILGNMDPDGVYPPNNSPGTNVECVFRNGKPYLAYAEPDIVQLNVDSAKWDPSAYGGQGGIVVTGSPQMPVCQVRTIQQTVSDGNGGTKTVSQLITNCKKK